MEKVKHKDRVIIVMIILIIAFASVTAFLFVQQERELDAVHLELNELRMTELDTRQRNFTMLSDVEGQKWEMEQYRIKIFDLEEKLAKYE